MAYKCKVGTIKGSDYAEVMKKARQIFHGLEKNPKREAHIRSAYFRDQKIFLNSFWGHLNTKSPRDKMRRLRFYSCAIELIMNSRLDPEIPFKNEDERLYRFSGLSADGQLFTVQIREELKTSKKYFTSVFPRID